MADNHTSVEDDASSCEIYCSVGQGSAIVMLDSRSAMWEAAAQEAAFEDLCFSVLPEGRVVNRHAMSMAVGHRSRFALPDQVLEQLLRTTVQDE